MEVSALNWNTLLQKAPGWGVNVKKNATVNDTIDLIVDTINQCAFTPYVDNLTRSLLVKSSSYKDFLKRVFDFACDNVEYKLDPAGTEIVTTPWRLINDGQGDCKKLTVLIASILKCAGIKPLLKVISYNGKEYEHIYVIVPTGKGSYITLDPVNHCKYNAEIKHAKAFTVDTNKNRMDLQLLGNAPGVRVQPQDKFLDYLNGNMGAQNILPQDKFLDNLNTLTTVLCDNMQAVSTHNKITPQQEQQFIESVMYLMLMQQKYNYNPTGLNGMGSFREHWRNFVSGASDAFKFFGETVKDVATTAPRDFINGVKDIAGQIIKVISIAGLAASRGAFLLLVKVNFMNLGKIMYNAYMKDHNKIRNAWVALGGEWTPMLNAIQEGNRLPEKLGSIGAEPLTVTAATAAPVLTTMLAIIAGIGGIITAIDKDKIERAAGVAVQQLNKDIPANAGAASNRQADGSIFSQNTNIPGTSTPGESKGPIWPWLLIGGKLISMAI